MIVAFVLISAALHAGWNALVRLEPDKDAAVVAVVAIAWLFALAVAVGEVAMGHAMFANGRAIAWACAAGLGETAYFFALARALDAGPLAPMYTISRGGAVVIVWPLSIALLGEAVTAQGVAGTVIVLGGLAASGLERGLARRAVAWAIACACCVAGYHLAYKLALDAGAAESGTFALALAISTAINVARLGGARRAASLARVKQAPLKMIAIGAVCAASFLVLMFGLRAGGAGLVLTLRNTSVLFATALAFAIGERPGARAIAGAAIVAGGAILLTIGQ